MEPVARRLAALLNQEVTLANDCVGDGIELMVKSLKERSDPPFGKSEILPG